MGQKVKPPPLGNFCEPPSFLPEGVLYSIPGVVKHINARARNRLVVHQMYSNSTSNLIPC